jgi:hypothetical protein
MDKGQLNIFALNTIILAGKIYVIVLLFVFCSAKGFTQAKDSIFYINFAGTGSINKTNNSTAYIFNNSLKFNINKKYLSINTMNNYIFGENESLKTNNDLISVIDVDLFKNQRRLYYWALASYEKSYSLNINDRFQVGGGLGLSILNSKNAKLVVSDGPLYENSRFSVADSHGRLNYETVRNSFRIKFHFVVKDLFVIDGVDFLQNSLSDKEDYNIRSNTTLSFRIRKWLSFTTAVTYNKLYLTGSENFLLNYGLMMERYF